MKNNKFNVKNGWLNIIIEIKILKKFVKFWIGYRYRYNWWIRKNRFEKFN